MNYTVIIPKPFRKQFDNLPEKIQERILDKIILLADEPRPPGAVKLKGCDDEYRIRIGNYRVRYEINDQDLTIVLLHCRHRQDVYKNK